MALRERARQFWERIRHTYYRLIILNNDTFEEVGSYKLSLFSFYVLVSSILVGVAILVVMLIVFTPLKRYIPGYEASSGGIAEVANRVDNLEEAAYANQTYITNFQNMLNGKVQTEDDMPKEEELGFPDSMLHAERSPADDSLRLAMKDGTLFDEHFHDEDEDGERSGNGNVSPNANIAPILLLQQMKWQSPVNGKQILGFDANNRHYGIDMVAPLKTPIKAALDGFVIFADKTTETGNTIAIQHANGIVTFYKHNSSLKKKVGDKVQAGTEIAIIGNTGEQTNGPHLHFEVWVNGKPIDPVNYIKF